MWVVEALRDFEDAKIDFSDARDFNGLESGLERLEEHKQRHYKLISEKPNHQVDRR